MNYVHDVIEELTKAVNYAKTELDASQVRYNEANELCLNAYHRLEAVELDEDNSYHYASELQQLLRNRRDAKGEWVIATKIYEAAAAGLENINAVHRRAIDTHNRISRR